MLSAPSAEGVVERNGAAGGTERKGARGARADNTETENRDPRPKVESPKDISARGGAAIFSEFRGRYAMSQGLRSLSDLSRDAIKIFPSGGSI